MKCLVLAAGHGSRLRAKSDSKPLTSIGGVPLIEHVIRAAADAGTREFVVVTGHEAERLEAFLDGLGARAALRIECVRLADWDRPNGHSVIAGAEVIDGDYLLMMSDHLFDPEIAARLAAAGPAGAALTLAVDRNLDSAMLDLEDATRVALGRDGEILRIGKRLEPFDAIDTGLFRATPALAQAIRAEVAVGAAGSLSEGVQRLASEGRATTLDVTGLFWLDVDDPPALALAEDLVANS